MVKIEFHRKRQLEAGKVVGNVPSLYIRFIRQRHVEKARGRQRQVEKGIGRQGQAE